MEENVSMEWKSLSLEWKKIDSMEYGKIVFPSILYHAQLTGKRTYHYTTGASQLTRQTLKVPYLC